MELPFLEFRGDYSIALKLLVKISGNGKFKGLFSAFVEFSRKFSEGLIGFLTENSLAKVTALGSPSKSREGFTEFKLNVKLKVDYAYFQMENLLLSSFGNKLINDNYKIFLEELVPGLEDSLSRTFSAIVNNILKDSTYDDMFPA